MNLTHRDTPCGPVLRLPWALLLAPALFVGFLGVLVLIATVQVLLLGAEVLAELRRASCGVVLVGALLLRDPHGQGVGR